MPNSKHFGLLFTALVVSAILAIAFIKNAATVYLPSSTNGIAGAKHMGEIDCLFVGSSQFRKGLSSFILERELSPKIYILGYNGNQPYFILRELETLLRRGVKVKRLYVDMYAFSAVKPPQIDDTRIIWDLDLKAKSEAFKTLLKNSKKPFSDAFNLVFSVNSEPFFTWPISRFVMDKRYWKGGLVVLEEAQDKIKAGGETDAETAEKMKIFENSAGMKSMREGIAKLGDELDPENVAAIREIVRVCRKNGIDAVFLETPKPTVTAESAQYKTIMRKYAEILDADGCKYMRFTDKKFSGNPENFSDNVHLSNVGGARFSDYLSRKLKSQ